MKKIAGLFLLLFVFSLTPVAVASNGLEAEKILKSSINEVCEVLSDKELTMDQKRTKVIETVKSVFGFSLMAKLSLGKKHWSQINSTQRDDFTQLFTRLFIDSYASKLDLFQDEKFVFLPLIAKKKRVQIPTQLVSKGKKYLILYKMTNSKDGWKVYDVVVEGISLVRTYRSQYNQVLAKGKFEDLLAKMKETQQKLSKKSKKNKKNKDGPLL